MKKKIKVKIVIDNKAIMQSVAADLLAAIQAVRAARGL